MIYNEAENRINIKSKDGIEFNIQIRGNKTVVKGASATGKTLLTALIEHLRRINFRNEKFDVSNILVINQVKDNVEKIKETKGKLIIIDDGDIILNDSIKDFINNDESNTYLIFIRSTIGLRITPNYVGEFIKTEPNRISLQYKNNVRGWN